MTKTRQYKKKYKIILCDIFATGVVYLQFRIVLSFIGPIRFVLKCSYFNL